MAVVKNANDLPVEYAREIIRGVVGQSKALELGRRLPDMNGKTLKLNVLSALPVANWVSKSQTTPNTESTEINRKPISQLAWDGVDVVAEEIAVIIPIAINTIADMDNWVDIIPYISEQAVGAFQQVIDSAVFFGYNTPFDAKSNLSTGLVAAASTAGATVAWDGQGGTSFYNAINSAMEYVEKSGFVPTAILGGPSLNSAFRGAITTLGVNVADQGQIGALPRHIDLTGGFDYSSAFAIVGDFRYLVYSIRQDMQVRRLDEATIIDQNTGKTLYNLAQQDMIALRFTMRLGFALPNPVNRVGGELSSDGTYVKKGNTAYPFAVITKSTGSSN